MKKLILILIAIFCCFQSNAQTDEDTLVWAPVGAKWWFTSVHCPHQDCGYYTIESKKDTVVNGITTRFMEYGPNLSGRGEIMYGDSNRVYHFDTINNEFYLLYDFSLQAGNTLTIQDTVYRGYGHSARGEEKEEDIPLFAVVIDSVVFKEINGVTLRILYTSTIRNENSLSYWVFDGPIIEGIGSTAITLFGWTEIKMLGGWYGGLRCYQDERIFYKNYEKECDYVLGIDNKFNNNISIEIFPNPADDYLKFDLKLNHSDLNIFIQIVDINGRIIEKKLELNQKEIERSISLNTSSWKAGIYFYRIIINDKLAKTGKVAIQR